MSRSALDTPMMRQFRAVKSKHPDAIVFYRMGDFYEMFLNDAELAAPLLDITLTTRDKGKADAVPMCGVPVHSADAYVKKLTDLGHRVAICEQVEDPRTSGKRLVRREVVEVVTPGLAGDPTGLDGASELSLAALLPGPPEAALALIDATTGDLRATAVAAVDAGLPPELREELRRAAPREILLPGDADPALERVLAEELPEVAITRTERTAFDASGAPVHPEGLDAADGDAVARAAAALLRFVAAHQPFALDQVSRLRRYALGATMLLDASTRAHLELFRNSEEGSRARTLIERIDRTQTPLGARRLARWLGYPLLDPEAIRARQQAVSFLVERDRPRARLREVLRPVRDLERRFAKIARPGATPRDLAALRDSLEALPAVAEQRKQAAGDLLPDEMPAVLPWPTPVPEAAEALRAALVDEPAALPRGSRGANETGFVRDGYRAQLDDLRDAERKGREWVAGLEARERENSGIANLKARFHPVHGYSLEVTKSQLQRVPEDWERKQTLASVERFTTAELREMEQNILGSRDRAAALERELLEELRQHVLGFAAEVAQAAEAVAELDAIASLAEVAREGAWVCPVVEESARVEIRAGRHPVVEAVLADLGDDFVPNDTELARDGTAILVLTGPNMSGKSTYLRQVAQIVLLAQIGGFVPAESARVGVVDRVFTRVGASDRLARGESTFMVEMRETAEILAQASARSLVILDEIGRGTSTFDGLSIAWAVAEYLHETRGLRPRTLFATHYHELTDLARTLSHVGNAHFEAREWGDEVVFLRRLAAGGASRSYGIQVARLAGLPESALQRAREILANLESGELDAAGRPNLARSADAAPSGAAADQLGLFAAGEPASAAERKVLAALRDADPERTTPLDALALLASLKDELEGAS